MKPSKIGLKRVFGSFILASLVFTACSLKKTDLEPVARDEAEVDEMEDAQIYTPNSTLPKPSDVKEKKSRDAVGFKDKLPALPEELRQNIKTTDELSAVEGASSGTPASAPNQPVAPGLAKSEASQGYIRDDGRAKISSKKGCAPMSRYAASPQSTAAYNQSPQAYREQSQDEQYASISENVFHDAKSDPLSTFSIDVDGASYSNARRFLQSNQLPPIDAIRIEEFINAFEYDYPQPKGSDPFAIITEVATTPWNPETKLVHIGLQGRKMETEKLPPANLVFLIDVSGSMMSEDKLPLLKKGFEMLVDQLRPQDKISLVVYAGAAGLVLPATSGGDKETILNSLNRLEAGGSTAGGAGLMLAYQTAIASFIQGGNNRVILATDGDFNVGISQDNELISLIEKKRKSGVFLSVLGFGTGNMKDAKMEQLADKGNGNYFYIDNANEARKVLVEKMAGTLFTIAKDVKLQIEFNPALVKSYRLIGYENRVLAAKDFNDDKKDAGELGSGTNVTALYEIVPMHNMKPSRPSIDALKYQGNQNHWNWSFFHHDCDKFGEDNEECGMDSRNNSGELLTVKFRYKTPTGSTSKLLSRTLQNNSTAWQDASQNFRFSAAVAGFGLLLRNSSFRGNIDFDKVAAMGRRAKGRDIQGHRAEFLELVERAKSLGGYSSVENREYLE